MDFQDKGYGMQNTCSVIINRLSGTFSEKKTDQVKSFLDSEGMNPRLFFIHNLEEATAISRQVCSESDTPLVIVGGGDGTINGVLNGFSPGAATMAILPFGTSNVLTRELEIDSLDDALRRIARGVSRPVPAGLLVNEKMRRYFLLMAGIGFDGSVVRGVRFPEKRMLGKSAYALSAIRQLFGSDKDMMEITADGRKYACHSLIICNSSKYAGKFVMAPGANLFEPLFRAVCVEVSERSAYLKAAMMLLAGKGLRGRGFRTLAAGEFAISGNKPVQVDGDYICNTPAEISIIPEFVRLIV
jgi:diacylglycerol kinase (ATP)